MTPADPRHGSTRGYSAGCREACCKRAHALDVKLSRLRKVEGRPRAIPAQGTQRRIQALMAMGWTSQDIADTAGLCHRAKVTSILNGQKGRPAVWVTQSTRDRIAAVYDTLSMRLPDMTRGRQRTRTIAARKGYAPPLAWDDIDNDPEPLTAEPVDVDEVVVERILDGERLEATQEEKAEVVRRWLAAGRPLAHLEAQTGWNGKREKDRAMAEEVA